MGSIDIARPTPPNAQWRLPQVAASVGMHLVVLTVGIAAPLLLLAGFLVNSLIDVHRSTVHAALERDVSLLSALVDSEIDTASAIGNAVARMRGLSSGDHAEVRRQAAQALQVLPGAWLTVTDAAGRLVLTTLEPSAGQGAATFDSGTAKRALESGQPRVSDLVEGPPAHPLVAYVAVPSGDGEQGRKGARFVVSVSLLPQRFADLLSNKFDRKSLIGVLDGKGRFVLRYPDQEKRAGTLASEGWRKAIAASKKGFGEVTSLEGAETVLAYQPTGYGGWSAGLAFRKVVVEAPLELAKRRLWGVSSVLLLCMGLLAWWVGQRIAQPARYLLEAASEIADLRRAPAKPSGVVEFDAVSQYLSHVAELLQERDQAIRQREQHLRIALDAAEAGTWTWDMGTGERSVDRRTREIVGWPCDAPIDGHQFLETIHPSDRENVQNAVRDALDPTGSGTMRVEYRIRTPDGDERWIISQALAHAGPGGQPKLVGVVRDITRRKRSEQKIVLLMQEVVHRSKNLLGVVRAVAGQTAKKGDMASFLASFSERIAGLAASQDLLVESEWNGVELKALMEAQLAHYKDLFGSRIVLEGPDIRLRPDSVQSVGMAVHELATNATKYGALSTNAGAVHIDWAVKPAVADKAAQFEMRWMESGGPKVVQPGQKGFGQVVIGRMVEAALKGRIEMTFAETGLNWRVTAPADNVIEMPTSPYGRTREAREARAVRDRA